jgi:hypothetical protein
MKTNTSCSIKFALSAKTPSMLCAKTKVDVNTRLVESEIGKNLYDGSDADEQFSQK